MSTTTPWLYPTSATGVGWTTPEEALSENDVWANMNLLDGESTPRLQLFGFPIDTNVPVGAVPVGVEVKVAAHIGVGGSNLGLFDQSEVYLLIDEVISGDNKSTSDPIGTGADSDTIFGGAADDWNTDISRDNLLLLGVSLRYINEDGSGNNCQGYIDSVAVRITYDLTLAGTATVDLILPAMTCKVFAKLIP